MAVDAEAYGSRNDRGQSDIQHELPRILSRAAAGAGLDRSRWTVQPQGDGQLALVPQDENEPRLVDDFVRHLVSELRKYNEQRVGSHRMRLRIAFHHGPVELADSGFAGRAVVTTCRLLASEPVYQALAEHPEADLALVLSDDIYGTTVAAGHTTFPRGAFRDAVVRKKEYEAVAWLWTPLGAVTGSDSAPAAAAASAAATSAGRPAAAPAAPPAGDSGQAVPSVVNNTLHNADARGSVFGFMTPGARNG
jgi:hypothetical protein